MKKVVNLLVFNLLIANGIFAENADKYALVIPIHGEISSVQEFILRRGLKLAKSLNYDGVILDINTPGGCLDITLKMLEMLKEYDKPTAAYINKDAISAGSYISVACDEIYFHEDGIIGAAAVVDGDGADVYETLKLKIDSYIRAKVRNISSGKPYRADVQRAMMDEKFVLTIDGEVIKPAGELLSLTAKEASKAYGDDKIPLLADGVFSTIEEVANNLFHAKCEVRELTLTGFEQLAKFIQALAPILIGIGGILLMIEFKTPGFGLFGALGISCFAVVILGNYVAGLAGLEIFVLLLIGAIIMLLDLTLLGTFIIAAISAFMIIAAIWWSNIDIWPNEEISWTKIFLGAKNLLLGTTYLAIATLIMWKLGFFKTFLKKFKLEEKILTPTTNTKSFIGQHGVAITPLLPSGKVKINDEIISVQLLNCSAKIGDTVIITGKRDFEWLAMLA